MEFRLSRYISDTHQGILCFPPKSHEDFGVRCPQDAVAVTAAAAAAIIIVVDGVVVRLGFEVMLRRRVVYIIICHVF